MRLGKPGVAPWETRLCGVAAHPPPSVCMECPPAKRPRLNGTGSAHVLLSCYDDPDKHVEVSVDLVESFGCRLASLVRHTPPCALSNGKLFWRAGMTRSMLITLVRSLTLGELVISKGVTVGEALATLEYEVCAKKRAPPRSAALSHCGCRRESCCVRASNP